MNRIEDIENIFLSKYGEEIVVTTLEDNKYLIAESYPFKKETFIKELNKIEFVLNGFGSNEFYITILDNSTDITFQVSDFQFTNSIFDVI